ncbi:MAG: hypothetical protein PHH54_07055 [Candidatus Nanoarchaeia archaeon]|nr:hypothetical protein [Candidatus Nanoarchaeia archaeon]MDD5741713.1 hypothetical protein [Candidatus Nanoarchaeia archaeon]
MRITEAINMSEKQSEMNDALSRITKVSSLDELKKLRPGTIVRTKFIGDARLGDINALVYEGFERFAGIFFENKDDVTLIQTYGFGGISINKNKVLKINENKVTYELISQHSNKYEDVLPIVRGAEL